MAEDELPTFDGIGSGYGWSISAWQFWNSRGTPEAQRLAEVSRAFSGRSSIWFHLWSLRNPNADWDTFDLAFLHQFQPDMRPILPEICWKEVEDWEIEWVEMRVKLLQQPHIDPETTKSEPEKEIIAASTDIQGEKEAEIDVKSDSTDAKSEENLSGLEHSDLEMKLTAVENAIVGVDAVAKEEGDDIMSEGGDNWRQNNNEDGSNNADLSSLSSNADLSSLSSVTLTSGAISSAPVLHGGAVATREGEPRVTSCPMAVPSSSVGVLRRGWLHRASPIAAKPPPLLAAVLPWDRDGDDLAMVQVEQERGLEEKGRRAEIVVCGESEIHVKIPSPSNCANLELDAGDAWWHQGRTAVAAEAIEVRVVDELALSLPTARNNDLVRGKEVGIDMNNGSNKPQTHTKRTHHANEIVIAVEALPQDIEFQFYIIHVKVEELNRDLIEKCKQIIHKCINDAKMDKREVQDVVNFDKTVAYGAAIQATALSESYSIVPNMVLADVIPLFLGVAFHGDLRSVVIMQNTAIHGNNLIGLVLLEKLSVVPQHHPINVSFESDFDGILIGIEEAAKVAWSMIFIDEIHLIACKWEMTHAEIERRILSPLFTFMDGIQCHVHVILIGTTKHSNSINLTLKGFDRIAREINIVVTAEVGQPVARNMNSMAPLWYCISRNGILEACFICYTIWVAVRRIYFIVLII